MAFDLGAIAETQYLTARLIVDTSGAAGPLKALNAQLAGMGKGWALAGQGLAGGVKFLERTTLATVGAAALLENQFIKVQDAQAAMARTLDGESIPAIALLNKQILEMSKTVPIAVTELYRIGEVIGTTGIAADSIDKLTSVVAKLGATTDLSVDEAGLAMARLLRIFGDVDDKGRIATGAAEGLASGLVKASLSLASSDQDILKATLRFAALGEKMELTKGQILSLAAVSTGLGQAPEAVGGSIQRVLQIMLKAVGDPKLTKQLKGLAEVSGLTAKQFREAWAKDPFTAIGGFLKGFSKLNAEQQAQLFGTGPKAIFPTLVRGQQLLQNLGSQWDSTTRSAKEFDAEIARGQLLNEQFAVRTDTLKAKIQLLWNAFTRAGVAFGGAFNEELGDFIVTLTRKIDDALPAIEQFGKEVGKWFKNINWDALSTEIGIFFGIFKTGFDIVSKLPPQILGMIALFKTLQALTGGVFGSIASALAGGVIRLVADQAFVQKVFVVNPGFGTGAELGSFFSKGIGLAIAGGFALVLSQLPKLLADSSLTTPPGTPARTAEVVAKTVGSQSGGLDVYGFAQSVIRLIRGDSGGGQTGHDWGTGGTRTALGLIQTNTQGVRTALGLIYPQTRRIADAAEGSLSATEKLLRALKPTHRAGEKGKSIESAEFRFLERVDPGKTDKVTAALAALIDHYRKQPIGTKGHERDFIVPAFKGIIPDLKQALKSAMAGGDQGAVSRLVGQLKGLKEIGIHLPPGIRRLIKKAEENGQTEKETKQAAQKVRTAVSEASDRIENLTAALRRKKLSTTVKPSWKATVRAPSVRVGGTTVRVTVGARTITRYYRGTVAYGPGLVLMQTGTGGAAVYSGGGGP